MTFILTTSERSPPETTSASTSNSLGAFTPFQAENKNNTGQSHLRDNESGCHRNLKLYCNTHTCPRDLQAAQTQRSAKDGELPGVSHPARDHHGDPDSCGGGRNLRACGRRLRRFTHRDLTPSEGERGAPTETATHRVYRCGAGVQRRDNRSSRRSVWQ